MKLQVLQENLQKAISITSRFASSRAQLPILGNILISAQKSKLVISSTNLEISACVQVGAKVEEEGEISIPAKILSEVIPNLPKEAVSLESEKEQLKIKTSGFISSILGMNSQDFPKIPSTVKTSSGLTLSKKELTSALAKVVFATSTDETRPILTGVLFIFKKDNVSLVATDGFRLSMKKVLLKSVVGELDCFVVPKGILNEISRGIDEGDENIVFNLLQDEKQVVFGSGEVVLSSRLLEGEYPDFEKILPKSSAVKILADKEDLERAVKLASVFARDSANIVKLKISKDLIKVGAESSSSGSQEMKVDAKAEGVADSFEIAFNYRFLEEFLHSVTGEEIKMEFGTVTSAGLFSDTSDPDYLHLIMPVKIQS